MNQASKTGFVALHTPNLITIFCLAGEPGPIHAAPLAEIQRPGIVFGFLAAHVRRVECLRAYAVFPLESKKLFLQSMDIIQKLVSRHKSPFKSECCCAQKNASSIRLPAPSRHLTARRLMMKSENRSPKACKTNFAISSSNSDFDLISEFGFPLISRFSRT